MTQQELIDLQTRLAFQDDAITALNATVARQQNQLGEQSRQLQALRDQLKALHHTGVAAGDEPPPPHY
ncbi:MAG: SlyX family protein [Candidatus Sedimenticola endophacoides]